MTDTPKVRGLVNDMETNLLGVKDGLEAALHALHNLPNEDEASGVDFIVCALMTRWDEVYGQWKSLHAAVCRGED